MSSTCLSVPASSIPLNYLETDKNYTYLYGYCVYNQLQKITIVANVNKYTVTASGSQWHCVT